MKLARSKPTHSLRLACIASLLILAPRVGRAQVLDEQKLLDAQTFWDNRDWDWYRAEIPFFECPDAAITTTYYYRWELLTKHLTYGSPDSGYSFTEFVDRPFWSGKYGSISCAAGHQLYEVRWLRQPRIARDYLRYWFHTPGAQPRRYGCWLADAAWALQLVHPDDALAKSLLPDLVRNYAGWEARQFVPEVGLFWQTGHDDGMEFNINSRQSQDLMHGAPGYRPSFNAYMWADAQAIAHFADLAGDAATAAAFRAKADALKHNLQTKLWDDRRKFFFPMSKNEEHRDGHTVKALSLTYQTGQFAGDPHGRELIGYVPWEFNLPDKGDAASGKKYAEAWRGLMDPNVFYADFGPTTVERHDPMFVLNKSCCWWSGQSWPYATTQTLKALANLLQNYDQPYVTKADYLKLLHIYAISQRKNGKPYIAEALNPFTGSFAGHDAYNHSEHYFHSGYCDLVITGLVGLKPRADDIVEVQPLAPADWDYFAIDDVSYHGHQLSILWDKRGTRYGFGPGLHLLADGKKIATSTKLDRLSAQLPKLRVGKSSDESDRKSAGTSDAGLTPVNFAVNNDGGYYPRITASHSGPHSSPAKLIDGNYWYTVSPPNRWTAEGSTTDSDWVAIDFGVPRKIRTVKLYVLDDRTDTVANSGAAESEKRMKSVVVAPAPHADSVPAVIAAPRRIDLEYWAEAEGAWKPVPGQSRTPKLPAGHRANVIRFPAMGVSRLRAVLWHAPGATSGLTEFEAWGDAKLPLAAAGAPKGR